MIEKFRRRISKFSNFFFYMENFDFTFLTITIIVIYYDFRKKWIFILNISNLLKMFSDLLFEFYEKILTQLNTTYPNIYDKESLVSFARAGTPHAADRPGNETGPVQHIELKAEIVLRESVHKAPHRHWPIGSTKRTDSLSRAAGEGWGAGRQKKPQLHLKRFNSPL